MAAAAEAIRISEPKESEKQELAQLYRMLIHDGSAALIGPNNTRMNIPPSVYDVLVKVAETMQEGKAIAVVPMMEQMSTQAAADFLGISRQFLVRELEQRKIAFHYAGSHRRLYFGDVVRYRQERIKNRRGSIERMAQGAEKSGHYDTFIPPDEER